MPADLEPPELARLVDYAERPRAHDWSLRSALTRYAPGQPEQVSDVLDVVRRIDFALAPHLKELAREGPAIWQELRSGDGAEPVDLTVELLRCMAELDRLGDVLATWAGDPLGPTAARPTETVAAVASQVARRLDELGVVREQAGPPRSRG